METIFNKNTRRLDAGGQLLYCRLLDKLIHSLTNVDDNTAEKAFDNIDYVINFVIYVLSIEGFFFPKEYYISALDFFATHKMRKPAEYVSFIINSYYGGIKTIVDNYLKNEEYEKCWIKEFENLNDISKINIEDFAYSDDYYNPPFDNMKTRVHYKRLKISKDEMREHFIETLIGYFEKATQLLNLEK